jgi:transposase
MSVRLVKDQGVTATRPGFSAPCLACDRVLLKALSQLRTHKSQQSMPVARAKASDDQALIAQQQLRIEKLTRELYGPRSERTSRLLDQIELQFEELESSATEDEIAAEMAVAKTTTVAAFTRKRPARKPFPEHLPRERVIVPGPTACLCCGGGRLRKLGETVTETLESIPRQWKVIQHVREKFTCRDCEKISQAPAPFHVIARGWAGPSLLAMILFEKFGQHQPLNRQAERYAKEGVPLSLSTLADQGGPAVRCWNRSSGVLKPTSSQPNDCMATTPRCRSWPRARPTPGDVGFTCATIARSAAPCRRRRCSITRATAPASIPRRISPTTLGFSRPTLMADTTSCTSRIASRARSWKQGAELL